MKFILILLVVLIGIWLWRASRPVESQRDQQKPQAEPEPLDMVRCTLCSVHVPSAEALQGKSGVYCSADHLHRAEP